jgi:UDP-glucose 4-epimerase
VVDDLSSGSRENVADGVALHELDIRDESLGELAARLRPEVVFHLAAQADVGTSIDRPAFDADVNVVGTIRVLEAARSVGARIVFASTGGAIYGECERSAREADERRPLSPYGTSKLAGEEYLATWNRLYGTSHVACRLPNVYAPRKGLRSRAASSRSSSTGCAAAGRARSSATGTRHATSSTSVTSSRRCSP